VVPETDGVKLMKGFTIQLGRKGTDVEQMSMMTTPEECICCVEVPTVHSQILSEDMQSITDSDIFISNCLNRHVLHAIQLGRKGTDVEQMSMREHPISELTG
jgi:hypothetical protein